MENLVKHKPPNTTGKHTLSLSRVQHFLSRCGWVGPQFLRGNQKYPPCLLPTPVSSGSVWPLFSFSAVWVGNQLQPHWIGRTFPTAWHQKRCDRFGAMSLIGHDRLHVSVSNEVFSQFFALDDFTEVFYEQGESVWRNDFCGFCFSYCGQCVYLFRVSWVRRFVMPCNNKPELFEKDDGLIVKCLQRLLLQLSSATVCAAPL